MIYALLYLVFILPFTYWLGRELGKDFSLTSHWKLLLGAVAVGLIASFLSAIYGHQVGNFLLHSLGGGVASALLYVYLLHTLRLRFTPILSAVLLFAFVSSLGILNELAEYAYELLHLGILSHDSHDTWRDLVANTLGAAVAWLVIQIIIDVRRKGVRNP